jgi:hypothetical protein
MLDVGLVVVRVFRIVEALAAACFQVIDPGQAEPFDKIEIEPKAVDDQVDRVPADRICQPL